MVYKTIITQQGVSKMAKAYIGFQLEDEEKEIIEAAAKKEYRTMSSFVLLAALARAKEMHGLVLEEKVSETIGG
jgi:uncharacterized protein (DUF1778 family)